MRSALQRDFSRSTERISGRYSYPGRRPARNRCGTRSAGWCGGERSRRLELSAVARRRALAQPRRGGVVVPLRVTVEGDRSDRVARDLRESWQSGSAQDGVKTHLIGEERSTRRSLIPHRGTPRTPKGWPFHPPRSSSSSHSVRSSPRCSRFRSQSSRLRSPGPRSFFLSQEVEMSIFVSNIASLIGIGVAVDYSLFVLARYREEVAGGRDPDSARIRAMSTSGVAVVFSGVAVVISLAGLLLVRNTALRSMAAGAMIVVALAVAVAVLLMPLLIRMLGRRGRTGRAPDRRQRRLAPLRACSPGSDAQAGAVGGRGARRRAPAAGRSGALDEDQGGPAAAAPAGQRGARGRRGGHRRSGPDRGDPTYVLLRFRSGTAWQPRTGRRCGRCAGW